MTTATTKHSDVHRRVAGNATLIAIILLGGLVFAAANVIVMVMATHGTAELPSLSEFYSFCPPCMAYFIAAPLVVAILVALMVRRGRAPSAPAGEPAPEAAAAPKPSSPAPALRLLALLQQEGRFVDFVQEDIDTYSDQQVGAAVRAIHAGCRKALREHVDFERIFTAADGSQVVVEPGFDPAAVRLTGNVTGAPPFHGTLQHGGWRAAKVSLPPPPGDGDASVLAPAEVEIK
jgi:hypothetical protein